MTALMDDPSTYLTRDVDIPMVLLAPNVKVATAIAQQYGISIQVNYPDPTKGVRVVSTEAQAQAVVSMLPPTTLWAAIPPGWSITTWQILNKYFGPPKTLDNAFSVAIVGKAWRPDQMMV